MKKIGYFIEIFLVFIIMINVKALTSCTTEEMTRVKELAKNVEFQSSYEVEMEDKDNEIYEIYYKVKIINLDKDLKVVYKVEDYNEETDQTYEKEITVTSDNPVIEDLGIGKKTLYIYSYTANLCTEKLLRTVTINLPKYNEYYHFNEDKCKANPDFKYCKEFMEIDKSFEEIDDEFDKYLKEDKSILGNQNGNSLIWYIVGGVTVVVLIGVISTILILKKRNKKDDI